MIISNLVFWKIQPKTHLDKYKHSMCIHGDTINMTVEMAEFVSV